MTTDTITLALTRDEAEAVREGLACVTDYYGSSPTPPTPAMTAQVKVNQALGDRP